MDEGHRRLIHSIDTRQSEVPAQRGKFVNNDGDVEILLYPLLKDQGLEAQAFEVWEL